MLSAISISGIKSLKSGGVIGLAPSSQQTNAGVFIDQLYNNGIVMNKIFSFDFKS